MPSCIATGFLSTLDHMNSACCKHPLVPSEADVLSRFERAGHNDMISSAQDKAQGLTKASFAWTDLQYLLRIRIANTNIACQMRATLHSVPCASPKKRKWVTPNQRWYSECCHDFRRDDHCKIVWLWYSVARLESPLWLIKHFTGRLHQAGCVDADFQS